MTIVYTVDLSQDTLPVRYILPGDGRPHWFPGPFSDPGEACQEFEATYGPAQYMDWPAFQQRYSQEQESETLL